MSADPFSWRHVYVPPNTEKNPKSNYHLPETKLIVNHLKAVGGDPLDLVETIAPDDPKLQKVLLLNIYQRLNMAKCKKQLDEWKQVTTYSDQIKLRFGLSKHLKDFANEGETKNMTLINKIGTSALPDAFSEKKKPTAKETKADSEKQSSRNELDHLTDRLG